MLEKEIPQTPLKDFSNFQDKFISAFDQITHDSKFTVLLGRFRYVYEFKKSIPWRSESGLPIGARDGLSAAINCAIAYHRWGIYKQKPEGYIAPDQKFEEDLMESVKKLSKDPVTMRTLVHKLSAPVFLTSYSETTEDEAFGRVDWHTWDIDEDAGPLHGLPKDLDQISVFQLRKELAMSLKSYWERIHSGNSLDPW